MEKFNKVITTTTTVLAMSAIGACKVSANNVTSSDNQSSVQKNSPITSSEMSSAQQNANSAKDAVASAQSSVDNAQKSVETDKKMVSEASSKVSEIQSSIKNQESTINNDQTTIAHDKQNISNQQKNVDVAKQNVSSAQANVNDKQSAVSSAQSDVNKDQQRIDDIHNAQAIASSAQNKVNVDKQDAANKQAAKNDAQKAVDQASSTKTNADRKVNDAQSNLTNTQNKENQDQAELDDTQKKLNDVNNQIQGQPTVSLPQGYVDALNKFSKANLNSDEYNQLNSQLSELGKQALANNHYQASQADSNEEIDANDLTYNQQKELTIFTASFMNQLRNDFGVANVQVTDKAIQFAIDCGNQYVKDNWDPLSWHDVTGLVKVEKEWGLDTGSNDNMYYEDAGPLTPGYGNRDNGTYSDGTPHYNYIEPKTMGEAKEMLYDTLTQMMFNDDSTGWLHAESLAGIPYGNRDTQSPYLGVSLAGDQFHIQVVPQNAILSGAKFNENVTHINTPDLSELRQQQSLLQSQVNDENNIVNADKQVVSNAQNALNDARNVQTQADNDLANKQATLTNATNALQQAQNQLVKDEATLAQAQKDIANAPAELKAANTQLAKDNQTLTNAKNALSNANMQLTNAKNAQSQAESKLNDLNNQLKQDEQHLANDQSTLAQLQKQLADYQNAPEKLKQDELELAKAQENLEVASEVEKQAELSLTRLQNTYSQQQQAILNDKRIVEEAQNNLNNLIKIGASNAEIEKAQAKLNQAEAKMMRDQKLLNQQNGVALANQNLNYTLSSDESSKSVTLNTKKNINETKETNSTANNKMPQAGESPSAVSLIGTFLLSILSFLGLTFKKKRN